MILTNMPRNNWVAWTRFMKNEAALKGFSENSRVFDGQGEFVIPPLTDQEALAMIGGEAVTAAVLSKFRMDHRMVDLKRMQAVKDKNPQMIALMILHTSTNVMATLRGVTGWEEAVNHQNLLDVFNFYDGWFGTTSLATAEDRLTRQLSTQTALINMKQEPTETIGIFKGRFDDHVRMAVLTGVAPMSPAAMAVMFLMALDPIRHGDMQARLQNDRRLPATIDEAYKTASTWISSRSKAGSGDIFIGALSDTVRKPTSEPKPTHPRGGRGKARGRSEPPTKEAAEALEAKRAAIVCDNCGKPGHMRHKCPAEANPAAIEKRMAARQKPRRDHGKAPKRDKPASVQVNVEESDDEDFFIGTISMVNDDEGDEEVDDDQPGVYRMTAPGAGAADEDDEDVDVDDDDIHLHPPRLANNGPRRRVFSPCGAHAEVNAPDGSEDDASTEAPDTTLADENVDNHLPGLVDDDDVDT